jgi:outer membrane protein OmpA-like peptidoglycan-associated protein
VVPRPYIDVSVELHAATSLSSRFGAASQSPVEALIGLGGGVAGFRLAAAVGVGLVDGWGAARVRALLLVEYRRPAAVRPAAPVASPPPAQPVVAKAPMPALRDIDDDVAQPVVFPDEPDVVFAPGRIELADPIFFDTNRKRVRSRFQHELDQLARALARRPELVRIWIEGHADATGPEDWNQRLSRMRAAEVVRQLVERGVEGARLVPAGFGEARPLVPTPDGQSEQRNRRVHFYTETTEPTGRMAEVTR